MKRTHVLFSVILSVIALLTVGLTAVFAADTVPSVEITGVDASNDCQQGFVWIHYWLNHNGSGSVYGGLGRDEVGVEFTYGWIDFSNHPVGPGLEQFPIPTTYPEHTIFFIELYTYPEPFKGGQPTYYSKIYFDCTTGEQIGDVQNTAYANLRRIEVPVAGPAFEHPGDIVSVGPQVQLQVQPQLQFQPEQINRQFGG